VRGGAHENREVDPVRGGKTVAKLEAMALANDIRRDLITVLRTGAVSR
jgi:hypothetical protein